MKTVRRILWLLAIVIVITIGALIILKRDWILDWWKGLSYEPSTEMAGIRDSLALTDRGEFLFKASAPKLSEREEFNAYCREVLDEEMSVLGCYTDGDIYVYNIVAEELSGIRELTTAHELLHAVWARMSEGEREELRAELEKVLAVNRERLGEELDTYDASQRQEELYVRAGTEVKQLPERLEKHYAEVFSDQDLVVSFYDKYIGVFLEIEAEMDKMKAEMDGIAVRIESLSQEYEKGIATLNGEIEAFNACAERAGCFNNELEFYARRAELVARQEGLGGIYEEINGLVEEYNGLVEKYNADVTRTEKLNRVMNSSSRPEEVD